MRIYYDTEFLEQGPNHPLQFISMGIVREDGQELYVVNGEFDIDQFRNHAWLRQNVMPYLPVVAGEDSGKEYMEWDIAAEDYDAHVFNRRTITEKVRHFLLDGLDDPELWAWYGAYDHVILAQLFNTMSEMPSGIPMYTNDIKQECNRLGNPDLPEQESGQHNALDDARWNKEAWEFLNNYAQHIAAHHGEVIA